MRSRSRKSKVKVPTAAEELIKVQLNANTVITITRLKLFAQWKERYPDAKIIYPAHLADN